MEFSTNEYTFYHSDLNSEMIDHKETQSREDEAFLARNKRKDSPENGLEYSDKKTKISMMETLKDISINNTDTGSHSSNLQDTANENAAVQDRETSTSDDDKETPEWDEICESIFNNTKRAPQDRENLGAFLGGSNDLRNAQMLLKKTFDDTQISMDKTLASSIDNIHPFYELVQKKISTTERGIALLLMHNHKLREDSLRLINDFDQYWVVQYKTFLSDLGIGSALQQVGEHNGNPDDIHRAGLVMVKSVEEVDNATSEPNWAEMIELNPLSREKIEIFLESSSQWNSACEELVCTFDDIRQSSAISHNNILQVIETTYVRLNGQVEETQEELRSFIMTNFRRHSYIEQGIKEEMERQRNIISRYMWQLATIGSTPETAKQNTDDKKKHCKSLLSFTTVLPLSR